MRAMSETLTRDIERRIGNYAEGLRRWPAVLPKVTVKQFLRVEFGQPFAEVRCREIFAKHPEVFKAPV